MEKIANRGDILYSATRNSTYILSLILLAVMVYGGCGGKPFGRPPGERVASCEGRVMLESGGRTKFRIDLYSHEGDIKSYLSLPSRSVRYHHIEDISMDDGVFHVETLNPRRIYSGEIVGDSLIFKGSWNGFSGEFKLDLDN